MANSSGKLEAIWIKRARRGPMDPVKWVDARADAGLLGNANQGGRRQVTVIEKEVFDQVQKELQTEFSPSVRRANLMVSRLSLKNSVGKVLRVGRMRLKVEGETHPCHRMDEAVPGLQEALRPDWRGGVYGVVLNDSSVQVGDPVSWE